MLPKIIAWHASSQELYFFDIDNEIIGYPVFYIGRNNESKANFYFVLRDCCPPSGKQLRLLRKEERSVDFMKSTTKEDEEKWVSGGITAGSGVELRIIRNGMSLFSLELMVGKGFANFAEQGEINLLLANLNESKQPIFDHEFWAQELAVREYMRADCRKIRSFLSSDSLMMTWCDGVEWHKISPWLFVATNQDDEFSGFAATSLSEDVINELKAVNNGRPILLRK